MRYARWLVVAAVVAVALPLLASDIQIQCEPGLRVYLDGEFVGVSTAEDGGLHLADVADGAHLLRIEKDGFLAQTYTVDMRDTELQVMVGELKPAPQRAPDEEPTPRVVVEGEGSLKIVTAPQSCVVKIDDTYYTKEVPRLTVDGVAAGEHVVAFSAPGLRPVSGKVTVEPGGEITVRCNLQTGEIEVVRQGKVEVVKERRVEVEPWGKGSLRVFSEPSGCTIRFLGEMIAKTTPVVNRSFVPAGDHPLVATWGDREVKSTITIKNNQRTVVTIRFADPVTPFTVTYEPE